MSLNQYNARLMTLISNANAIKKGKTQQNNLLTVAPTSKEQYQNQAVSARTNSNGFQLNNKSPPKGRISSGSHGNLLQGGVLQTVIQLAAANYQTLNTNSSTSTAKKTQNQPIHHPTAQHSRNNSNLDVAVTSASNTKRASTPGQYQVGQKYQPLGHDSQIVSNVKVHSKTEFAQEMKKILAGSAANMPTKPTQTSLIANQSNTNNSVNNQQSQSLQQSSSASALLHVLPGSKQQNQQSISSQQQSKKPHHGYSLSEMNDPSKQQLSQNSYGSYAEMHSSSKKNNSNKTDELQLFKKSLHDLRLPNVPAPPLFNLSGDFRSQSTQPARETNPLWKTQQEQRQSQPQKQQQQQPQQTVNSQQLQQQQQQQLLQRTYTEAGNDNSNYNNISSQNGEFSSRKVLTESDEVQMIDKHFLFTKPTAPKLSSTSLLRELKAKKATQSAMYKQVASQKLTSHLRTDSSGTGTSFLKQSFQQTSTSQHQHPTSKKEAFAGILAGATQSNGTSAQQSGSRTPLELVNLNNSQKLLVNSKRSDKYNNNLQQYAATTSLDSSSFKNYLKQRKNNTPDVSRATTDKQDSNINPLSTFAEHIPARDSNNFPSCNDLRARSSTPQNSSKQQGTANPINNLSQPDNNLSPPKQLQIQSPYGLRAPTNNPLPVFTLKNPSSNSTFSTNSLKNPSSTTHSTSASSQQAPSPTILPSKNQLNSFGVDNNANNMNNFSNSASAFMNTNNNNNGNNQIISMPASKNAKNNSVNNFLSAQNLLKGTDGSQSNQLKGDGAYQSTSVKQTQSRQDGAVVVAPQMHENNTNSNKSNNMKMQKINSSEKLNENHQLQVNATHNENKQSLPTQKEASQVNQFGSNMQQQAYNMQMQSNNSFPHNTQQQQVQQQSQTQQNQGTSLVNQKSDNPTRKASETILKQEPNVASSVSSVPLSSPLSIIKEYQYKTKAGCNYNGPKTNQDNFFITPNLNNQPQRTLFSVCDGHGVNGHYCSAFLKKVLPKKIEEALAREITNTEDDFIENSLHLAFLQTSKELLESSIDCTFSGSTCVLLLVIGTKMWTANTGDSRAILCSSTQDYWYANPLSRDHKPDDPDEYERIISRGGRVETYLDENLNPVGPYRVWLQDENIPGLAMARSFGDVIASQVGVTCEPEVMAFEIGSEDKFIVLASDGVWEFISNEEVMSMLVPSFHENDIDGGCTKLIKESHASWRRNDDVVDDITCIVVYLQPNGQLGTVLNK